MAVAEKSLQTNVEYLTGVGPMRGDLLRTELNIHTFGDLLQHYPFRYVDRCKFYKISEISSNLPYIQVVGTITSAKVIGEKRGRRMVATLKDESGKLELVWFKGLKWIQEKVQPGYKYLVFGKPSAFQHTINIVHPEMELLTEGREKAIGGSLQPVYSATEKLKNKGLDSKGIERLQQNLLKEVLPRIKETLPEHIVQKLRLMPRALALKEIHFPSSMAEVEAAQKRLKFEELFFVQLRLLQIKGLREQKLDGHVFSKVGDLFNDFYANRLPFDLTGAQKRVLKEIWADMKSGHQMNRLLQGDVGSGKTVVALLSMLMALDNGMQAALMAPTEILSTQHFQNISGLVFGSGIKVDLLTGSTPASERKRILEELKQGHLHIIIGTHALLEDKVKFGNLGLVVIDEQHRFGVQQRARLWGKNKKPPHVLIMTATPIPRTLAMTFYGDLDTSVIDELPPGRKSIQTKHIYENKRLSVFGFLRKQIAEGRQVYIVYPLIEESATLDYANLMEGYESISREFPLPQYKIGIVHGRMKPADKELEMQNFKKGVTQILVATSVIEVGVDVPNATVMVIENAERFGLSQLHQLRGRVGRGGNQSYCILITGYKLSNEGRIRMETMVRTNNGFEIAEADLQLRGPGDITGTQQSGTPMFQIADLAHDHEILKLARHTAMNILKEDEKLERPENLQLRFQLQELFKKHPNWSLIS